MDRPGTRKEAECAGESSSGCIRQSPLRCSWLGKPAGSQVQCHGAPGVVERSRDHRSLAPPGRTANPKGTELRVELMHVASSVLRGPQIVRCVVTNPGRPYPRRGDRVNASPTESPSQATPRGNAGSCFNAQAGLGEVGAWEETKPGRTCSCLLSYRRGRRRMMSALRVNGPQVYTHLSPLLQDQEDRRTQEVEVEEIYISGNIYIYRCVRSHFGSSLVTP